MFALTLNFVFNISKLTPLPLSEVGDFVTLMLELETIEGYLSG